MWKHARLTRKSPSDRGQDSCRDVGELTPLTERIVPVDYDPIWPRLFERDAARVRVVLGSQVLRLEHTASTSVP